MRFLRIFAISVIVRFLWQISGVELRFNQRACCKDGVIRYVGRIGSHIGDETCLVQPLRKRHGLFHTKS